MPSSCKSCLNAPHARLFLATLFSTQSFSFLAGGSKVTVASEVVGTSKGIYILGKIKQILELFGAYKLLFGESDIGFIG